MTPIDLRSDTVTRPDAEMRRAMAEAEVGDDVLGEDPTVRRLEEEAATVMGTEASLFVPTGTMGNQIALHLHGKPGSEVICEAGSHIFDYEMGAMAALSGLLPRPVPGDNGLLTVERIERAIAPPVTYRAPTSVVSLENTANMAGGTVYPLAAGESIQRLAQRHGLPVHLDGARIFNAALALGEPVHRLAAGYDSVMFSLSKGLGAPVGSMLCGAVDWIDEARRVRKMFGGGMRQAGVLAAAARVGLHRGADGLTADHELAAHLGDALAELPGVRVINKPVQTNIVIVEVESKDGQGSPASDFVDKLAIVGIRAIPIASDRVRMVTHRDVDATALSGALAALGRSFAG